MRHESATSATARRAAAAWLLGLTVLNVVTHGSLRITLLYAIPVCAVAWYRWQAGLLCAALAVACAWIGGAMPDPASTQPAWLDGLFGFARLSVDALVAHAWGRRMRARADVRRCDGRTRGRD